MVHTVDDGCVEVVTTGMGKQHFLRACCQMRLAVFAIAVHASAVQHHIHTQLTPRQRFNAALMQDANHIIADEQLLSFLANVPGKAPMAGIVFQQMRHTRRVCQFIDSHYGDFRPTSGFI
ncbi:hypothetical protein D3C71_1312310 [compost metagenome]